MGDDTDRPPTQAAILAPSLVGLAGPDAVRRVEDAGLEPQVVPPGVTAVTLDYRERRIRLFVDEAGRVERATAG